MRKVILVSDMGYKPASEIKSLSYTMLRHGESQPRIKEGASHHARRGKNAEAFLIPSLCDTEKKRMRTQKMYKITGKL